MPLSEIFFVNITYIFKLFYMRTVVKYFIIIFMLNNNLICQENLIKSIQLLDVNNNEKLIFNDFEFITVIFDELNENSRSFYYEIEHYDFNWKLSNVRKSEFLDGFDDIRITNYNKSYNTLQNYIHYRFQIPNKNLSLTKSGNYKIIVKDNNGNYIFSRKFILIRNPHIGSIEISKPRNIDFQNSNQNLKITIPCNDCNFNNNSFQYKLIVHKNYNLKNSKVIDYPTFKLDDSFVFDNITFSGGLQFFNFDNSNILNTSIEIKNINLNTTYVTELREDKISNIYVYEPDINGKYIIKNNKENKFTESEYSNVIFSLQTDKVNNYPVYVIGNFNNYETNENSILKKINNQYRIELFLKQGFYNYKYVIKENNSNNEIENFWQTENLYTAILYEKRPEENYFKIKAIAKNNSSNIVN
ncbi:MAG: hypothetical protein CMC16_02630 [Flavobacteriaceae bacterium]|nr:hypothetical protein [Flavobacteriaceae bacterium]